MFNRVYLRIQKRTENHLENLMGIPFPVVRFGDALRTVQDHLDSKNYYAFNPSIDLRPTARKTAAMPESPAQKTAAAPGAAAQ